MVSLIFLISYYGAYTNFFNESQCDLNCALLKCIKIYFKYALVCHYLIKEFAFN